VGNLPPRIHHDLVRDIHELVEMEFVNKMVGLLSVPVEDEGFFPLE
jgi:hypothetical protein